MSDTESVDYLQTGFDPKSLTVPRLRSILVTHNVQYPATAKKPQLIDLFNEQVVPQSKKYLNARARAKRTSRGIVDADSQATLSMDDHDLMPPPTNTRARSPRKGTRVKQESEDELPPARESPRKRQSRSVSNQPVGASDTDTGTDADGTKPGRRGRRAPSAAAKTPAIVKHESQDSDGFFKRTPETEGVFTSDNPFQSGGSSPPAPAKTPSNRRKTAGHEVVKTKTPSTGRRRTDGPSDGSFSTSFEVPVRKTSNPKTPKQEIIEAGEEFTPEAQLELDQDEAEHPTRALVTRPKLQAPSRRVNLTTPLWVLMVTLLGAYAAWYRQEKVAVGYCGLGRPATKIIPENVELPEWATALAEPQCEPCPPHAYCYDDFSVRCEPDFILKPHPLSFGGLVPLPPTCEPDGEKVRRIQAVADKAVEELRDRRAKYECGEPVNEGEQPLDSPAIEEEELRETISLKRNKRMSAEEFDDLWVAAIGEVKVRDEVEIIVEEPETGDSGRLQTTRLSSTSLARLPLTCAIQRSARLGLARHRLSLGGVVFAILSALYGRGRYRSYRATAAQIPPLVDVVLERLAAQKELAFETDGSDDAFLFLPNLRDDVLRSKHSLAERERIWQRVRAVVEQNSNVRTGQREGHNGEVGRAWEWIGPSSAGAIEGSGGTGIGGARRRKSGRVSWGPDVKAEADEPTAEMSENKSGLHRKWDESRPIY